MDRELIQVKQNQTVTTSLLVAEKFNKNHRNVLSKIKSLNDQVASLKLSGPAYFIESEYIDQQGKNRPMYYINRDGFSLLAMSFTGAEALKWKIHYINAFNAMENRIKNTLFSDNRFELAKLIATVPDSKVHLIRDLYPEHFNATPLPGSLEYISDINTSYMRWIADYNIDKEWIKEFPTIEIYNNYVRYCLTNHYLSMGKKLFYRTLERDFNFTRRQKGDGFRYFIGA